MVWRRLTNMGLVPHRSETFSTVELRLANSAYCLSPLTTFPRPPLLPPSLPPSLPRSLTARLSYSSHAPSSAPLLPFGSLFCGQNVMSYVRGDCLSCLLHLLWLRLGIQKYSSYEWKRVELYFSWIQFRHRRHFQSQFLSAKRRENCWSRGHAAEAIIQQCRILLYLQNPRENTQFYVRLFYREGNFGSTDFFKLTALINDTRTTLLDPILEFWFSQKCTTVKDLTPAPE